MGETGPAESVIEFDYSFDKLQSNAMAALNALTAYIGANRLSFEQVHAANKAVAQKAKDISDAAHRNRVPRFTEPVPVDTGQTDTEAV